MVINIEGRMSRLIDPQVRFLVALADSSRLEILRQLAAAPGPLAATRFTDCCGVTQPTVSHHLKVLREAGWVTAVRDGTRVSYALNAAAAARLRQLAGELGA
jgi:ArsR family transcriptional regulator